METNLTKCFICDVECDAEEKFLGTNIARTLTTPMSAVLAKCLRTDVDTENEYFCSECTRKIEEYDQMVQLSLQIETELYELFRKKPIESCYLLDAEIISEPVEIHNEEIKTEDELNLTKSSENDSIEPYDEMVIEYLDEYETQSMINDDDDDNELHTNDIDDTASTEKVTDELEVDQNDAENEIKIVTVIGETGQKGRKNKRTAAKSRAVKKKKKTTIKRNGKQIKEEIDLNCKKCSFTANNHEEIEKHKQTEHLNRRKPLTCDICGRTYKSKSALSVHVAMHNGITSHECHECGKTFTQRGALVRHMPMHTGERPHQCEVCGKRFIHYSSFHMHQMIHTNEKKKKCQICGQEFRSNSHMNRHLRTHTGEKPYACPICGQKFAQRYNMKTHYNTHQGIHRPQSRNHKCILCMEAFPRREKLNKHLRQAHGVNDEDIRILAEKGPNSEEAVKILERLKSSVYTKEEVLIEYIDEVGSADDGIDNENENDHDEVITAE